MCKITLPTDHSEYSFFSVEDFSSGNIKPETKMNGEHYPVSFSTRNEEIKLAYDPRNKTWNLVNQIDNVIHFNITNPDTGTFIEGNFTPNISIINNNFYSDFLIVNWRDTEQNGSCYRIHEFVTSGVNGGSEMFDHGIIQYKYENPLGINKYDEIRTNISLSLTPDVFNDSRIYEQKDAIIETSCTSPYLKGSNFTLHFLAV
jgi:hypothetical protein